MDAGTLTIDRQGLPPGLIDSRAPFLLERPGDPSSPVWTLCEVELASGRVLVGGVRLSPPQARPGEPPLVRATGLMADIDGRTIDLMCGSERARAGMAGWETIPVRIRLIENPPYEVEGLSERGPRSPLARGEWSRTLQPRDLAGDLARMSPRAW